MSIRKFLVKDKKSIDGYIEIPVVDLVEFFKAKVETFSLVIEEVKKVISAIERNGKQGSVSSEICISSMDLITVFKESMFKFCDFSMALFGIEYNEETFVNDIYYDELNKYLAANSSIDRITTKVEKELIQKELKISIMGNPASVFVDEFYNLISISLDNGSVNIEFINSAVYDYINNNPHFQWIKTEVLPSIELAKEKEENDSKMEDIKQEKDYQIKFNKIYEELISINLQISDLKKTQNNLIDTIANVTKAMEILNESEISK